MCSCKITGYLLLIAVVGGFVSALPFAVWAVLYVGGTLAEKGVQITWVHGVVFLILGDLLLTGVLVTAYYIFYFLNR